MPEAERLIPEARHEPSDIGPGFIWGAAALCLGTLLACALLVLWLYPTSWLDRRVQMPLPRYPEPRLQARSPRGPAALLCEGDASPQRYGLGR